MKMADGLEVADEWTRRVVTDDLKVLDNAQDGLADAAARYVLGEGDETVLSTLNATPKKALRPLIDNWSAKTGLQVDERRQLFRSCDPYDDDLIVRYVEVVGCAYDGGRDFVGSGAAPQLVQVFVSEILMPPSFNYRNSKNKKSAKPTITVDVILRVIRRLGGSVADFFDCILDNIGGAHLPMLIGGEQSRAELALIARDNGDAVFEAVGRFESDRKAYFLSEIAGWGLLSHPGLREVIFALAGDGKKAVRQAAVEALLKGEREVLAPIALDLLEKGDAKARYSMVQYLGCLGDEEVLEPLRARLEKEKTASVRSAIEIVLAAITVADGARPDDETGYVALDGTWVEIPPIPELESGETPVFGEADRKALLQIIAATNTRLEESWKAHKKKYGRDSPRYRVSPDLADKLIRLLNAPELLDSDAEYRGDNDWRRHWERLGDAGRKWLRAMLQRMPQDHLMRFCAASGLQPQSFLDGWDYAPYEVQSFAERYLDAPNADLRVIDALAMKFNVPQRSYHRPDTGQWRKGDGLRQCLWRSRFGDQQMSLPAGPIWPYVADNFDILDETLGVARQKSSKFERLGALQLLRLLPKTPKRYFASLLEIATGATKAGRAEARMLLSDGPEVDERLIDLLQDKREAMRAGAAVWIAERGVKAAIRPIKAQLKKEKSDRARAAMLTSLGRLGEDLSSYIGPTALKKEAEAGLKKAKFDKLDWIDFDALPKARFKNGAAVPAEVLRWWIYLAFKLKEPGGNRLFDLYLGQLESQSAAAFSQWVVESWIAYDIGGPSPEQEAAYAQSRALEWKTSSWLQKYNDSEEAYLERVMRAFRSQTPNSGAATKGLLALARYAPPSLTADIVRRYLKEHGQRASQASALLEMLAAAGDPVSLQVVIAAATRLKQKGVQNFAGELIQKVADEREWTMDELADRTVPTAGFDDDGRLGLPCGPDEKRYEARLGEDLKLALLNPDGKTVKALPGGADETTKASKKQLSASKKELKQIVDMQSARLYEALCAERRWPSEDWMRDFNAHPVMRKLTQRLVWLGLDDEGAVLGGFRPTAEGDFTDAEDAPVDPNGFAHIRLAHGALVDVAAAAAWSEHLDDYEIKPLFAQFSRAYLRPNDEQRAGAEIVDRKGWVSDAFTIRGAASKLGYERGSPMDGGFFTDYRKSFTSADLVAVIEFTGNCLPEDNVPAALLALRFYRLSSQRGRGAVKLSDVPPVLLSECWHDYHGLAAKAAYDAEWEKRTRW